MMQSVSAGYSGTPLAKKLGVGAGSCVLTLDAPADYKKLLAPIPSGVTFVEKVSSRVDVAHLFATNLEALERKLKSLRVRIRSDASVWVSWPKKASRIPSDVTENAIRSVALPMGFVDVKVCAVTDIWSGLKLVIRKELR